MTIDTDMSLQATVLAIARTLVKDEDAALEWFRGDAIASFDGMTAAEMFAQGQGEKVLCFLLRVLERESCS